MADIEVGVTPDDFSNNLAISSYTAFNADNPANDTGALDTIKIWANTNITACRVGTFYLVSGTTYKCRDSATIGNVTAGSEQTFTEDSESNPLAIEVEAGDFIGCFASGGAIERETSGYTGVYVNFSGESIDPGDEATYTFLSGSCISLWGEGTLAGVDVTVEAVTATANGSAPIPTLSIGLALLPPQATANGVSPIPTLSIGLSLLPPLATATATALIPSVGIAQYIEAVLATANGSALIPTLSIGSTLLPPVATADGTAPIPVLAISLVIQPPVASADAEALTATLFIETIISAVTATATATALIPTLLVGLDMRDIESFTNLKTISAITGRDLQSFTDVRDIASALTRALQDFTNLRRIE